MAHKKYTKTEIQKLLVEERRKSRTKQQHSVFMNRSRGMYNGQVNRYVELRSKPASSFPYTLEEFRAWCRLALTQVCLYCAKKLTPKTMCADHRTSIVRGGSFQLRNIRIICTSCNFRKGLMTEEEFLWLSSAVAEHLEPIAVSDLWRRLVVGGRWSK